MTKRVLTIDDSRTMRDMLRFALTSEGFDVVQAENGAEGLKKLGEASVDVVITDINMPVMDGIEFIETARKKPELAALPILILTTESTVETRERGRAAGGTGWLVKPVHPEKLVKVVRKVTH